jgi:lysophospholipase L1-like esterase
VDGMPDIIESRPTPRPTTPTFIALCLLGAVAATTPFPSAAERSWVAAWTAAPDSAGPPFERQSIRQIVRTSIGGPRVRIRLSNLFGAEPVRIDSINVATHGRGSTIIPGTTRAVTFNGASAVTIAAGGAAVSDPIAFPVIALQELAVSFYLPARVAASTVHGVALQTTFIAHGDRAGETVWSNADTDTSRFFLTDVEVEANGPARAVVILGDSITDGVGSTTDANRRWSDALAERLQADPALASIAVVNAGVAGNRILNDGVEPFIGPSSLSRFDRDVLDKPGVRWVILLQGSNDISASDMLESPGQRVTAPQIIAGMQTLIARAHARGVRIWGATILPRGGVQKPFVTTAAGTAARAAVNDWIRTSGAFDAIIDFERVMRDPERPDRLLPAFDSGDHLHPNNAGYRAMATAVDLRRLTP